VEAQDAVMQSQRIIRVSLQASDGERWDAIGGGDSVDAALEFAVQSAPDERRWRVTGWRDLYGD
jgi:hypothetical protein